MSPERHRDLALAFLQDRFPSLSDMAAWNALSRDEQVRAAFEVGLSVPRASGRGWAARRRAEGRCINCSAKAVAGTLRCAKHRRLHNEKALAARRAA